MAVAVASMFYASSAAFAALPLAMTGRGSGAEGTAGACNGSGNSCTDVTCQCYPFSGTGTATGVGALTFQTNLVLTFGTVDNLLCDAATGALVLTQKTNSGNVLTLDYQGLSCDTFIAGTLTLVAAVFNGSYAVDGGSSLGKFAGAMGSGTLTGSVDGSSTLTLGNLNGTLLLHH
jgi:hypothetical protein